MNIKYNINKQSKQSINPHVIHMKLSINLPGACFIQVHPQLVGKSKENDKEGKIPNNQIKLKLIRNFLGNW